MYQKALKIAYKAHNKQLRRDSNIPYIIHPIRVSQVFNDDFRKTIAILHDVIEDTDITFDDLRKNFSDKIINVIDCLSRRENEQYFDYIKRLSKNEIAIEIKIADMIDNLSDTLSIQPISMINRYNKTLKMLII